MSSIPENVSEYFKNGRRTLKAVTPNDDYTLTLQFDNDEIRIYDMSKSLTGVMQVLQDKNKFKECFIDQTGNIAWDIDKNIDSEVVWNNRIDLCTDSVYLDSVSID